MRLLTISNCPLLAHQGSGYVTLGYVEGLRARGWTVHAYGPEHFEPWKSLRRAASWRITLGMLIQALSNVLRADYDIVEFYGGEAWLALSVLARWPGRRFLLISHSNGLETFSSEQLRRHLGSSALNARRRRWYQVDASALMASGFRNADALVMVSANELRYAREKKYQPDAKLLAIDNPLPDAFSGLPLNPDRKPIVVYCGSWIARKGIALIAADIPRVLREVPGATLRLIGVGEAFRVEEHFPADVLRQIEVVPFISDKDRLRAAYAECAVAIVPSAYESFGLTIAEAMACGCAVVASRTGFAAGLRDDVEICLLPEPASPHLFTMVKTLLDDPEKRKRVAAAGRSHVQRLRWTNAVDTLSTAYETWLAGRKNGSLRQQRAQAPR